MKKSTIEVGRARHIVTRKGLVDVQVLCQPGTSYLCGTVEETEKAPDCQVCVLKIQTLIADQAVDDPVPYSKRGGTVLSIANPAEGEADNDTLQERFKTIQEERNIRVPWWKRLAHWLHLR
jgi:hypothetical protein